MYGISLYASSKFRLGLALKFDLGMLELLLSILFGSRVACELARFNSLTKRAKIYAWLVTNLTEPSQVESSYKRTEPAHEFLAHGPALHVRLRESPCQAV
jgi:hypothetical protein